MEKQIAILGTARDESNTHNALKRIPLKESYKLIELHKLNINKYKYSNSARIQRPHDDFSLIIDEMIEATDIIFATPVYWYSMSGEMKIFFDRLTDLVTIDKKRGRALAGKCCYLLATGSDAELPEGFEVPFKRTAEYFGMKFVESYYFAYT